MTTGTITTTVTFADLIQGYDDELDTLRDAYEEITALLEDESEAGDMGSEERATLYQQAQLCNESAKKIQERQHGLEQLRETFDGDEFELKMLSGQETIDIETALRMRANRQDVDTDVLQAERKGRVVDAATVDAPDAVPREDGSPVPSQCPNPLTFALYERVEELNNAGTTDFRAPGFGEEDDSRASVLADAPTPSAMPSSTEPATDESVRPSGDSSATRPTQD